MKQYKNISISGKQTKVGKSLTKYVNESIIQTLKKYFESFISANILFSKDTYNFRCEINIHIDSAIFIQGNALSNDAYGAFNVANEKIKKRLRRYHKKLTDHRLKNRKSIKYLQASEYIIQDGGPGIILSFDGFGGIRDDETDFKKMMKEDKHEKCDSDDEEMFMKESYKAPVKKSGTLNKSPISISKKQT